MTKPLLCDRCGAGFQTHAELDHHLRHDHVRGGQKGELPLDANGGIQQRPATGRQGHESTRSHKE